MNNKTLRTYKLLTLVELCLLHFYSPMQADNKTFTKADAISTIDTANENNTPGIIDLSNHQNFSSTQDILIISQGAFVSAYDDDLKEITIPTPVRINSQAFKSCGVKKVTFVQQNQGNTNSVILGDEAFAYCKKLTSITIPAKTTKIGRNAFTGCGLTAIAFDTGIAITSIGDGAFQNCGALTSIAIPNSVKEIGNSAFAGCGLNTVDLGSGVTSIGNRAFADCKSLTSIRIPNSVTKIGQHAFARCGISTVDFGSGVTSIGYGAFADCEDLTDITIPNTVTKIGPLAFAGCRNLAQVTIQGETTLEDHVFDHCDKLTSITASDQSTKTYITNNKLLLGLSDNCTIQ